MLLKYHTESKYHTKTVKENAKSLQIPLLTDLDGVFIAAHVAAGQQRALFVDPRLGLSHLRVELKKTTRQYKQRIHGLFI